MKLLIVALFFLASFAGSAQSPASASAQQGITFRLLDIAVVERVSTGIETASLQSASSPIQIRSANKWTVNSKKISAAKTEVASFFKPATPESLAINPAKDSELYTLSTL